MTCNVNMRELINIGKASLAREEMYMRLNCWSLVNKYIEWLCYIFKLRAHIGRQIWELNVCVKHVVDCWIDLLQYLQLKSRLFKV
jgi:hypothetical protein